LSGCGIPCSGKITGCREYCTDGATAFYPCRLHWERKSGCLLKPVQRFHRLIEAKSHLVEFFGDWRVFTGFVCGTGVREADAPAGWSGSRISAGANALQCLDQSLQFAHGDLRLPDEAMSKIIFRDGSFALVDSANTARPSIHSLTQAPGIFCLDVTVGWVYGAILSLAHWRAD
jgi:hypothetical protein